jgi:archaemetzincin
MESPGGSAGGILPRLNICAVGLVDRTLLIELGDSIHGLSGVSCEISEGCELPRRALDRGRGQYDCHAILKCLMQVESSCLRVIGVTKADIYVQALRYVYGVSQVNGRCSIISTHRLIPEYYGELPDKEILLTRLTKTAIHELGHSLGLTHCRDKRCVMFSSIRIVDTDYKDSVFCPTCKELFRWNMERCMKCRNL